MTTMRSLRLTTVSRLARPPFGRPNLAFAAAFAACIPTLSVGAEATAPMSFDIPAQDLSRALSTFTAQSHVQVLYEGDVAKGLRSTPLKGSYTPEKALKALLTAVPVQARFTGARTVTLERKAMPVPSDRVAGNAITLGKVTVSAEATSGYDPNDPYNPDYNRPNATTATKTDTPLIETPVSVQVVPKQVLQDQQAYRIQDAVKNVSGVQQVFTGGGYDQFIVRGFDNGNARYRNGVRIPGVNLDLANVEQVEVLKGPAAVLYGRSQPGGLINIVTKRPLSEPYYALEQRFGSYDYYRTQARASGPVTQDGELKYNVDLSYLSSNSFREQSFNDRIFVAPSLSWKASEDTELNISVEYLNEDRVYDSGIPAIGDEVAKIPITRQFDQPGLNDHHEYVLVDFNWSHAFNQDWKLQNGVVAMQYDADHNETYGGYLRPDNRTLERYAWFGSGSNDMHTVYLNLTGKFQTSEIKHSVLVGGEYYVNHSVSYATDSLIDTVDIFNPVFNPIDKSAYRHGIGYFRDQQGGYYSDQEDTWYGLYFQDHLTLWDKFHILGGGRYDWASVDLKSSYFSPLRTSSLTNEKFSPRVGIVYQPQQWLSLYGNYTESLGSNNGLSQTGKAFEPESGIQFEGGMKMEFFGGRFTSTLAYYDLVKENILTPGPNPQFRVPIGEARSRGVELDVSGEVVEGLRLIATYAYTDTEITKDRPSNQGNRLPGVPLHSGSFWVKYDFQQEYLKGLSLGAGAYAAGKRFGGVDNSYHDDGYARIDLYGAYRFRVGPTHLTAQLNLNNITDAEYFVVRDRARNLPAEPLTVLGSLRLDY